VWRVRFGVLYWAIITGCGWMRSPGTRRLSTEYGARIGTVLRSGALLRQAPDTFSVPRQFAKHMMVVADIARGDAELIGDAIDAAWLLQRSAD
jgi:hypothetical protein